MPIIYGDVLAVAKALSKTDSATEADYRSAISRAYYAMYHRALHWEDALPAKGHNIGPAGGVHQQLVNRLANPDTKKCSSDQANASIKVKMRLDVLRQRRKTADYELDKSVSKLECIQQIQQVESLIDYCNKQC